MDERNENEGRSRNARPPSVVVVSNSAPRSARRASTWVLVLITLLVLLLGVTSVIAWNLYKQKNQDNLALTADDKKTIVINIGKHVVIPTAEEPVFATVTDPEKLADQPFFFLAKTGDKVLVYQNAKRAILYRPSIDRVIEMMPYDPSANFPTP